MRLILPVGRGNKVGLGVIVGDGTVVRVMVDVGSGVIDGVRVRVGVGGVTPGASVLVGRGVAVDVGIGVLVGIRVGIMVGVGVGWMRAQALVNDKTTRQAKNPFSERRKSCRENGFLRGIVKPSGIFIRLNSNSA